MESFLKYKGKVLFEVAQILSEVAAGSYPSATLYVSGFSALQIDEEGKKTGKQEPGTKKERLSLTVFGMSSFELEGLVSHCYPEIYEVFWMPRFSIVIEVEGGGLVEIYSSYSATPEEEVTAAPFSIDAILYCIRNREISSGAELVRQGRERKLAVSNKALFQKEPLLYFAAFRLVEEHGTSFDAESEEFLRSGFKERQTSLGSLASSFEGWRDAFGRLGRQKNVKAVIDHLISAGIVEVLFPFIEKDYRREVFEQVVKYASAHSFEISEELSPGYSHALFWVLLIESYASLQVDLHKLDLKQLKNAFEEWLQQCHELVRPTRVQQELIVDSLVLLWADAEDEFEDLLTGEPDGSFFSELEDAGLDPRGGALDFEEPHVEWYANSKEASISRGIVIQMSAVLASEIPEPMLELCTPNERIGRLKALNQSRPDELTFLLNSEYAPAFLAQSIGSCGYSFERLAQIDVVLHLFEQAVRFLNSCGFVPGRAFPVLVKFEKVLDSAKDLPVFVFTRDKNSPKGILLPDLSFFRNSFSQGISSWDSQKDVAKAHQRKKWSEKRAKAIYRGPAFGGQGVLVRALGDDRRFDVRLGPLHGGNRRSLRLYSGSKFLLDFPEEVTGGYRLIDLLTCGGLVLRVVDSHKMGELERFSDALFKKGVHFEEIEAGLSESLSGHRKEIDQSVKKIHQRLRNYEKDIHAGEDMVERAQDAIAEVSESAIVQHTASVLIRYVGVYFPWIIS